MTETGHTAGTGHTSGSGHISDPGRPAPALAELHSLIDELWPESFAEPWDSVGLTAGDPAAPVRRVLLAVDPVDSVIAQAAETGTDLLLTHHPLLLRGVTTVAADTLKGGQLTQLIRSGIAHIAAHTNADTQRGGVSDVLLEAVLGTSPAAGGAWPLLATQAQDAGVGVGRWTDLAEPTTVLALAQRLARVLPATVTGVRISGEPRAQVSRVAVCAGAGDSLFDEVRDSGADVYITSDLRHHPATEARDTARRAGPGAERGRADTPHLIDISHWAAESLWLDRAAEQLGSAVAEQGWDMDIEVSRLRTDAWDLRICQDGMSSRDERTSQDD